MWAFSNAIFYSVIDRIARILSDHSAILPTELYNEGWMLRLVMDWYSRRPGSGSRALFEQGARWFSQGRLSSQFLPRYRGDKLAETHTNTDGIVGHFDIAQRSEVRPKQGATQLLVLEAKLASRLSSKTKNAPGYDQAARSVACLAHVAGEAGIAPGSLSSYGLWVIVPRKRLGEFTSLATADSVKAKVRKRVDQFGDDKIEWYNGIFLPHLESMSVGSMAWEDLLSAMESEGAGTEFRQFYQECCAHANL